MTDIFVQAYLHTERAVSGFHATGLYHVDSNASKDHDFMDM